MSKSSRLFIIGAQKAGTTYLANLLSQHDEVCLSNPKEPDFFTRHWDKGQNWYDSKFSNLEKKYLIDASTSYSAAPIPGYDTGEPARITPITGVPERIHMLAPAAKFIYLLRDPVKRAYSAYWHNVRAGHEKNKFRKALTENQSYIRISSYYDQLKNYLKYYDVDRFQLILFEEFINQPAITANHCFKFMGLNSINIETPDRGQNRSFAYTPILNKLNRRLSNMGGITNIIKKVKPIIPSGMFNFFGGILTKGIPAISTEDKDYLKEIFHKKNEMLKCEFNINITYWE